jgi:hypothetical protein
MWDYIPQMMYTYIQCFFLRKKGVFIGSWTIHWLATEALWVAINELQLAMWDDLLYGKCDKRSTIFKYVAIYNFLWRVHVAICCECGANIRLPFPKLLMQIWLPQHKLDRKLASCYNWCKEKLFHGGIEPRSFDPAQCSVERPAKPHISTTYPPPNTILTT